MVWYCCILLAAMMLLAGATWAYVGLVLKTDKENTLRSRADRLAEALQHQSVHPTAFAQTELDVIFSSMPEGSMARIVVFDKRGDVTASRAENGSPMPYQLAPLGFAWIKIGKTRYKMYTVEKQIAGSRVILQVASQYEDNYRFLNRVLFGMLGIFPSVIVLSSLGGYVLSGRALRPMRELANGAASISITNLTHRLPNPDTGDELQTIAESFDGLLGRLEDVLQGQKRFTADASHDLRTPLTIIRTTAEVALRAKTEKGARQALADVLVECGEMEKILDDLLLLARLDGNIRARPRPVTPMLPLLTEVCDRIAAKALESGIHFTRSFHLAPSQAVRIDPEAFTRAIGALLDNAIQYTSAGGSVTIEAIAHSAEICCTVRDTGIGISPEALPHIFERFFRGDQARTVHTGGTGLGLAIAKWTVESHDGRIEARSKEGVGTEIDIVLPVAVGD